MVALWSIGLCVAGCGRQDGVVGKVFPDAGATSSTLFETEFVDNLGVWSIDTALPRASVTFGQADAAASDGKVAELRFPGDAGRTASDSVGPSYVTQIATVDAFSFGTLRTRVNFGSCGSGEEVILSVLGYFNDGSDGDRDGIVDNTEIDLQIACSAPSFAYLTVFTDYESTPAGTSFQKRSHVVDFSTGTEYDNLTTDSDEFVALGTDPDLKRPELVTADKYYELVFEWRSDHVRFFLNDGTSELTLWTLDDASCVPQGSVNLLFNLWHPDTHWFPNQGTADYPVNDVILRVDWLRYQSLVP